MSEAVDIEARKDIAKLYTALRELSTAVWGDDVTRDNGIRSEVREHRQRLDAVELVTRNLITDLRHYLDKERAETCIGLAAIKKHEEETIALYEESQEEETEVKVAQIQAGAQVGAARTSATWQATAMVVGQLLTLVGIIIVALK